MFVSVYVTAASMEEAERLARDLLDRRLAACANAFPIASWYWWEGKVEHAREVALLLKTRAELVGALGEAVRAMHSYSVPCVVAWPIAEGDPAYLGWVRSETTPPRGTAGPSGQP